MAVVNPESGTHGLKIGTYTYIHMYVPVLGVSIKAEEFVGT